MSIKFEIDEDSEDYPSDEVLNDESHNLSVSVDLDNRDVYMKFSSSEAMRDFAISLLQNSQYGSGEIELYPLGTDDGWQVVDGVRLTENSSRVFIAHPNKST